MSNLGVVVVSVLVAVCILEFVPPAASAGTNCGVHTRCSKCPGNFKKSVNIPKFGAVDVCCPNCESRTFYAGNNPDGRAYCTCPVRTVRTYRQLQGTCWKGTQCSGCNQAYVGNINGVSVCCARCVPKGLIISPTRCDCNNQG